MSISHHDPACQPAKIAIFRALQLGDLLCAVPAWRALRASFPKARIALIGLPWARAFVDRFSQYLDEFIEFPGFPGLAEQLPRLAELPDFIRRMQDRHIDWILQMHGNGQVSNIIVALLGAKTTWGYFSEGHYCPDRRYFLQYPDHLPEVRRHLRLMERLGVAQQGEELEFPLTPEDWKSFEMIEGAADLAPRSYVCLHPGGRGADRRWAPDRFAEVGDALASLGLLVVLTGSTEEKHIGEAVERAMRATPMNLMGRTTLGSLGVLMQRARLLVSNDTGVSHVAAALGLPSVIIVVGSDPVRWGPLDRHRHRLLLGPSTTPDAVVRTAGELLRHGITSILGSAAAGPELYGPGAGLSRSGAGTSYA